MFLVYRKARGADGVILGPDVPTRGLCDVLKPAPPNVVAATSVWHNLPSNIESLIVPSTPQSSSYDVRSSFSSLKYDGDRKPPASYRLIQCGHSNSEKKIGIIRVRHKGTDWSKNISLDFIGNNEAIIQSKDRNDVEGQLDLGVNLPSSTSKSKDSSYLFPLGVTTCVAEAPFDRTKLIIIIDKTILVNSIGKIVSIFSYSDVVFTFLL